MTTTDRQQHWQKVYQTRAAEQTSWFRPHLDESLRLIDALALPLATPVIDIGAGRSTLVDDLLDRGFRDLTALDISAAALQESRARLGEAAPVRWLVGDVLEADLPADHYGLWHDRAVFHFLTDPAEQARYVRQAARSVSADGVLIVAAFSSDGPDKCSGLPVCRHDAGSLAAQFADAFVPLTDSRETHRTPFGTEQAFTYVVLRRIATGAHLPSIDSRASHATD